MASLLLLFLELALALALAPAPAPAIQSRPEAKPSDTDALTIFRQLADAHGILASNWSTPDACSGRWRGVGCSSSSGGPGPRVTSLSLPALDLRGTLVPLAHLDQLRVLDLHGNRLNGTLLPLLAALPNLKLLYLAGNELSGDIPSAALGRLSRLLRLDLAGNDLHGPIPAAAALANLTRLLTLRLQNNLLSGRVPDLSAVLPRLAEFNASNNELYGPVPDGMRAKFGLASFAGNAGLCGPAPPLPPCSFMPHESPPSSVPSSPESSSSSSSQSVVPSNPSSMPQRGGSGGDQMMKAGRRGNGSGREGLSGRAIVGIAVANAVFLLVVLSLIGAYCCFAGGSLQQEQKADKRIRSRSARAGAGSGGDGRGGDAHDLQQGQGLGDEEDERGMRKRSCRYSSDGSCDEAQNKLVFFEEEEEEEEEDDNIIVNIGSGRSKLRRGIRAGGRRRPRRFELEELLRASAEMLGKGSVGTVYRAVLEDGCMVAVKRLKDANPCPREEFHKYMELIGRLRHPNLVRLWAYYYAKQEKLLIYSYLPNASLHTLLHGNRGAGRTPLDWTTRIGLVLGAARGLASIHEAYSSPSSWSSMSKIPHGNVKSSNVLLDKNGVACIADFGLALLLNPAHATARLGGYRAPEQAATKRLSQEADVYALGVLILEVLTGRQPTAATPPPPSPAAKTTCRAAAAGQLASRSSNVVNGGGAGALSLSLSLPEWVRSVVREEWTAEVFDAELLRYKKVEDEMVALLHVGLACVATQPDRRPSMGEVVKMIEDIRVEQSPLPEEDLDDSRLSLSPSLATTTEDGRLSY